MVRNVGGSVTMLLSGSAMQQVLVITMQHLLFIHATLLLYFDQLQPCLSLTDVSAAQVQYVMDIIYSGGWVIYGTSLPLG